MFCCMKILFGICQSVMKEKDFMSFPSQARRVWSFSSFFLARYIKVYRLFFLWFLHFFSRLLRYLVPFGRTFVRLFVCLLVHSFEHWISILVSVEFCLQGYHHFPITKNLFLFILKFFSSKERNSYQIFLLKVYCPCGQLCALKTVDEPGFWLYEYTYRHENKVLPHVMLSTKSN